MVCCKTTACIARVLPTAAAQPLSLAVRRSRQLFHHPPTDACVASACAPQLLSNFIYKRADARNFTTAAGAVDLLRFLCSRDLTISQVKLFSQLKLLVGGVVSCVWSGAVALLRFLCSRDLTISQVKLCSQPKLLVWGMVSCALAGAVGLLCCLRSPGLAVSQAWFLR